MDLSFLDLFDNCALCSIWSYRVTRWVQEERGTMHISCFWITRGQESSGWSVFVYLIWDNKCCGLLNVPLTVSIVSSSVVVLTFRITKKFESERRKTWHVDQRQVQTWEWYHRHDEVIGRQFCSANKDEWGTQPERKVRCYFMRKDAFLWWFCY